MKAALQVFLAAICALLFVPAAFPHGGGLDKNEGHHNRKTGQYHQHRSPANSPPSYSSGYSTPLSTTPRYSLSSKSDRNVLIGKHFLAANGPEVLSWDGNKFKRDDASGATVIITGCDTAASDALVIPEAGEETVRKLRKDVQRALRVHAEETWLWKSPKDRSTADAVRIGVLESLAEFQPGG